MNKTKKNNEKENNLDFYIGSYYVNTSIKAHKEIFKKRFNELLNNSIKKGHQQKEITEKTGISPASITQYKNGTNLPKGEILERLANYFEVSSNYLIGKSDTPTYSFEDINNKTGLSQKAIETLYRLQHNCFEEDIDITSNKKKSDYYSSQLDILNLLFENSKEFTELLNNIKMYKELKTQTKKDKEKIDFYEYKLTKNFMNFLNKI